MVMALDHGELNIPLTGKRGRDLDAQIVREVAAQRRAARAQYQERQRQAREAEAARHRYTADEIRGASAVRDAGGWHRVIRVSTKSVTVATPYSWTDRIPLDKVLDVRHANA